MPWSAQDTNSHGIEESIVFLLNEHDAQARAQWHVRGGCAGLYGGTPKKHVFIGERENVHHASARAHFSKCAPCAGESSILLTRVGAHDLTYKENEHRALARAPFSTKLCTARKRERRGASPAHRPEAPPPTKHLLFINKVYAKRTAPRREIHEEAQIL